MDYQAFYEQLRQGRPQTLYLFEGEEEYGKESALQALRKALLKGPMALMNESVLTNPPDSELIAVCETLPIMEERRLVIVRDSQHLLGRARGAAQEEDEGEPEEEPRARGDQLTPYLASLPDTVCLVFFVRGKANGARRLYRKIKDLGGIVSFDQLDQERLLRWVIREFRTLGLQADRQAAEHLVFACGRELMTLKNEVAKIAAYAGGEGSVTPGEIDAIATLNVEYKVFDLSDKVAAGKAGEALPLMNEMLKGREQRLMLLALLQRHYRQLLLTKIMLDKRMNQNAIAAQLGLPGFVIRRLAQSAQAYSTEALQSGYLRCIKQEYLVKSGQVAEEGSLEQLVLELIHIRQGSGVFGHA